MITKEQAVNGIVNYIDDEIMPLLATQQKWVLGTFVGLSVPKISKIIDQLVLNSYAKLIEIVNSDGLIDIDKIADALNASAQRYGKLSMNIPIVGTLTFAANDMDKIVNYMKGS